MAGANLSDWLGTLAEPPGAVGPDWLALIGGGEAFRETGPFAASAPAPAPAPDLPPDPLAEALAQARAEGERAGRAAAAAEAAEQAARQRALRLSFRALDEAAQGALAEDLAATVLALCDSVLAEAALDRDALLARCHAAARRIGAAAEGLALHLHPDDIALLDPAALAPWRIVPDPALERGSVLVEGPEGSVSDGPAEWRRAIAAAVRG
jgi:flagellar assembly protein FliH